MVDPKTGSPLGSTVRDYLAGQVFLHRALPLASLLLVGTLYGLAVVTTTSPLASTALWSLAALSLVCTCIGVYGLYRIGSWLPTVSQQCYELVELGGGGSRERVLAPPHAHPTQEERTAWEVGVSGEATRRASTLILRAKYSDRLGNNVFQYVYARLRAAHLDLVFEAPALGGPFSTLPTRVERWEGGRGAGGGTVACHASPLRPARVDGVGRNAEAWRGWLEEPSCRYSMNTRLFAGMEGEIGGWLRPCLDAAAACATGGGHPSPAWGPCDVAIHLRLGDILWGHHVAYRPLPCSYFRQALTAIAQRLGREGRSIGRVGLVVETPGHELVGRLEAALLGPSFPPIQGVFTVCGSVASDLAALYTAPAVVLSISSFSWWPAALSRTAKTVVMPLWGLLLPHHWQPSPLHCPTLIVRQDLTIRDYPEKSGGDGGGGGGGTPSPSPLQGPFPPSPRVIEIPLPHLPCWGGNTKEAMDQLFRD
jgi:hypothetical protein